MKLISRYVILFLLFIMPLQAVASVAVSSTLSTKKPWWKEHRTLLIIGGTIATVLIGGIASKKLYDKYTINSISEDIKHITLNSAIDDIQQNNTDLEQLRTLLRDHQDLIEDDPHTKEAYYRTYYKLLGKTDQKLKSTMLFYLEYVSTKRADIVFRLNIWKDIPQFIPLLQDPDVVASIQEKIPEWKPEMHLSINK